MTAAAGPRRIFAAAMLQPSVAGTGGEFHAPPARVPLDELSRAEQRMRAAVARTEAGLPPQSEAMADVEPQAKSEAVPEVPTGSRSESKSESKPESKSVPKP
ncbi:MAG: hypothetical protein ACKPJD_18365, partial [Planctomycetaceae bacterium]